MYPKFIELHDGADPIGINVALIEYFADETISMTNSEHRVLESYDEIKQLIRETGSLIHKADPRLDTTHPLTYDEMREMPGQPVWHSNTDQWALIAEEPQYADRVTVWHSDGTITNVSREDAIANPWYRMKQ